MKINHVSIAVTMTLVVIVATFTVAIGWSLNHLNSAFKTVEFFGQQKDKIYTQINTPIATYLHGGDAALLLQINKNLTQFTTEIQQNTVLSDAIRTPFLGVVASIQQSVVVDLTSAGKMADPQVLLIHNEQQLSAQAQSLFKYVDSASHALWMIEIVMSPP